MIDFLVAIFEWFGGWTIGLFVFIFFVLSSLFWVLLLTLPSSFLKPLLNKPKRKPKSKPLIKEDTKEKIQMFLWKWFVIIVFILLIISYFTHPSSNSIEDTGWLRWSKGW